MYLNFFMFMIMLSGFLLLFLSFFTYSKLQDNCKYDSLKRKLQISIGIGSTLMALGVGFFICILGPRCKCDFNLDKWKIYLLLSSTLLSGIGLLALTLSINSELNNKDCEIDLGPTISILGTISTIQVLFSIFCIIYTAKSNTNLISSKRSKPSSKQQSQPVTSKPVSSQPVISKQPSKPVISKQPSKPVISKLVTSKQPSKPVISKLVTSKPVSSQPVTSKAVTSQPVSSQPSSEPSKPSSEPSSQSSEPSKPSSEPSSEPSKPSSEPSSQKIDVDLDSIFKQSQPITSKKVYGGCMDCNEYPDRKTCAEKTGVPLCYMNKESCITACKSKEAFKKAKQDRHLLHEANRSARRALYQAKKSKKD